MRVVIIGNSGGGKSVLARRLAERLALPLVEIDALLWLPGWKLAEPEIYGREHARSIADDNWIIEGLGTRASVPARLQRATHIVLIDLPLWVHFWLAAERDKEWRAGGLEHPPAGHKEPAPLRGLFRTIHDVDREWMPEIRRLVSEEEDHGKHVFRLAALEDLNTFDLPAPARG
jgi:hypothetical protein